jgi:hypothetical protein
MGTPDQIGPKPSYWQYYRFLRDQIEDLRARVDAIERSLTPKPIHLNGPVQHTTPPEMMSERQRNFILQIADALGLNVTEQIDRWDKTQASYWIDQHLAEYNNKTSPGRRA